MTKVDDSKAISLEIRNLWRRAASRWLEVMMFSTLSDDERLWIYHRRRECLSKIPTSFLGGDFKYTDVLKAARALESKMGISPNNRFISISQMKKCTIPRTSIIDIGTDFRVASEEYSAISNLYILENVNYSDWTDLATTDNPALLD